MRLPQILVETVSHCCLREKYLESGHKHAGEEQVVNFEQDRVIPFFHLNTFTLTSSFFFLLHELLQEENQIQVLENNL